VGNALSMRWESQRNVLLSYSHFIARNARCRVVRQRNQIAVAIDISVVNIITDN